MSEFQCQVAGGIELDSPQGRCWLPFGGSFTPNLRSVAATEGPGKPRLARNFGNIRISRNALPTAVHTAEGSGDVTHGGSGRERAQG